MGDKSFVTMEQKVCQVCGVTYDTGSILIDKRMKDKFERQTLTGWGLCNEDQKQFDDGFLALVECKNNPKGNSIKQEDADRTGNICYIHRRVATEIFNQELPANLPLVFVEIGVIAKIQSMLQQHSTEDKEVNHE